MHRLSSSRSLTGNSSKQRRLRNGVARKRADSHCATMSRKQILCKQNHHLDDQSMPVGLPKILHRPPAVTKRLPLRACTVGSSSTTAEIYDVDADGGAEVAEKNEGDNEHKMVKSKRYF